MTIDILALVTAVSGLLVYALAGTAKPTELGRIAFAVGLLVLVAHAALVTRL